MEQWTWCFIADRCVELGCVMLCFVWVLVFCCVAGGQGLGDWSNNTSLKDNSGGNYSEMDRTERFFSFFSVIRFKNIQCTGNNGLLGVCYSRKECTNLDGIASGNCARNWGTCCVIQKTCGSTANLNCTYFVNRDFPNVYSGDGRCTIVVSKCHSDICQLRIDFLDFILAQPSPEGVCVTDQFEVVGSAYNMPTICGENSGQHVYADFVGDNTPIQLTIRIGSAAGVSRKWNIRICQIGCGSSERAPAGALMYYRELTGNVKSFNYAPTVTSPGTRQLVNMNYGVVVRPGIGYCSIRWTQDASDPYSFTVSEDTDVFSVNDLGTPDIALNGETCFKDFIVIPHAKQTPAVNTDRFCGNALVQTTSFIKPFFLAVVTDNAENMGVAENADIANRGFSLSYRQMTCN